MRVKAEIENKKKMEAVTPQEQILQARGSYKKDKTMNGMYKL